MHIERLCWPWTDWRLVQFRSDGGRVLLDGEGRLRAAVGPALAPKAMLKMPAPLRALARVLEHGRSFIWRFTGTPPGVHAIALTAQGNVILVKLNYANGWSCPGGGIKSGETPEAAIVRELREEIGMTACAPVERLKGPGMKRQNIFLVRNVQYQAEPSLEIRHVREFDLEDLPPDFNPASWRRLLSIAHARLRDQG